MPTQDLKAAPAAPALAAPGMAARRVVMLVGSGALATAAGTMIAHVVGPDGVTPLEATVIALSTVLSGWIGFGFMTALAGFLAALPGGLRAPDGPEAAVQGRTAILMPVYNEDPGLVLPSVQAICEDLRRAGAAGRYDVFVLSDTRDERIAQAEATGVLRMRSRLGPGGPAIHYRRRVHNTDRKAGNIAEWVRTCGGGYDYMLVLDADSLMSADAIVQLSAGMDREPRLGLLQTVPLIVNARTPFARLQQFANRLYGPVFALGHQWWAGAEGNYWGHNAIIRVQAFAESAGLPHLPGKRPFGGHIMSHDFVEAALLRRRGWAVRMAPALQGSYEETPPTLLDMAARDRRWCQGNLQHTRLMGASGLHWVSRLHLACGVFAYVAPALWLLLLVCGAAVWPAERVIGHAAMQEVAGLFALTVVLLAGPKLMALALALRDPQLRAGFGGKGRLLAGFVAESVGSMLIAPVMMLMQTAAVVEVLVGRDSGWAAQRREGSALSRGEAWRAHRLHVALGVLGGLIALAVNRYFLLWTSPVFLGLALSAVLSLHTSRPWAGRDSGRPRVLQIPEERDAPQILARCLELRQLYADEAGVRREIDVLFREPAAVYAIEAGAAPSAFKRSAA